jgi:multiple sugar transport system substrate-binding protein
MSQVVRVALVGGPMYDPLYDAIPAFEHESGIRVDIVAKLAHPELNGWVRETFGGGEDRVDLLSTHTKYAPSQAQWLEPLDDLLPAESIAELLPRPVELARIDGRLFQVPRNLDVRLLHYRRDLFEDPALREAFEQRFERALAVPDTWTELADVAGFLTAPDRYGFLFPGRDSGLFGTFFELLVGAGGALFHKTLEPAFDSTEGEWAAAFITDLHKNRRVTPRDLAGWHYDEVSAAFREGRAALVCDWPGSYHLYTAPETCRVADRVALAPLPAGPAGLRAAYAGCHSFAIARTVRNRDGAIALLRFLTSPDSQLREARSGAIPCHAGALRRIREEAASDPVQAVRWRLLADAEKTMIIPPRFAAYPDCEDAIWRAVQEAMQGSIAPRAAVRRAAAKVDRILQGSGARGHVA